MERHSEIKPFAESILENQLAGYDCTYLIQTITSWDKGLLDTTESFRLWAAGHQIVDYGDLPRGAQAGKSIDSFYFYENRWLNARVKFYRPNNPKRLDKRVSIQVDDEDSIFSDFVGIGDILFFFEIRGYIYMFSVNPGSNPEAMVSRDVLQEMLTKSSSR